MNRYDDPREDLRLWLIVAIILAVLGVSLALAVFELGKEWGLGEVCPYGGERSESVSESTPAELRPPLWLGALSPGVPNA